MSNRPRVLYLTYEFNNTDGWARCTVNWINGLAKDVSDADILTLRDVPNEKAPWDIKAFLLSATNGSLKKALLFLDYLNCIIRLRKDYDIVHCLIEPLAPLAHKLAERYNAKLMIQFVGTYCVQPVNTRWKELYYRAYKYSSCNISISNFTRKRAIEEFPNIQIDVAHIGVDEDAFNIRVNNTKKNYFLFVGASKPRKGLLTALEGFYEFCKLYKKFKFRIVGFFDEKNSYNRKVLAFISQNNLPVEFIGSVDHEELQIQFSQCIAHVLPSVTEKFNFEGFGLVHLEANMCGSLTIGTRDSANEEIISHDLSGYLVDQGDPLQVCDAMRKCVTKNSDRDSEYKTAEDCRNWAKQFTWQTSIDAIVKNYLISD